MSTEEEIAKILSPAIDARAPYAKIMIGMLTLLVAAEREACAVLAETFFDGKTDNISCHQANGADKIAQAIRNR